MTFTQLMAMVGSPAFEGKITADSREVRSGDIFVAVSGTQLDGHDFIGQAIDNDAACVVCEKPVDLPGVQVLIVDNSAAALGLLAQQSLVILLRDSPTLR